MSNKGIEHIELVRGYTKDLTFGRMLFGTHVITTLEPPWKGNLPYISCIPAGWYEWKKHLSPKFKHCVLLQGVKDRSNILIHKGNSVSETKGCILVGLTFNGKIVGSSKTAYGMLMSSLSEKGSIHIGENL